MSAWPRNVGKWLGGRRDQRAVEPGGRVQPGGGDPFGAELGRGGLQRLAACRRRRPARARCGWRARHRAGPATAATAGSRPAETASIAPGTAAASRISSPRLRASRIRVSASNAPAACSATSSPKLWPATQSGSSPRLASTASRAVLCTASAGWAHSVAVSRALGVGAAAVAERGRREHHAVQREIAELVPGGAVPYRAGQRQVHRQVRAHADVLGALARKQEADEPRRRPAGAVVHQAPRRQRLPGLDPRRRVGELGGQVVSVPGHDGQPGLVIAV